MKEMEEYEIIDEKGGQYIGYMNKHRKYENNFEIHSI